MTESRDTPEVNDQTTTAPELWAPAADTPTSYMREPEGAQPPLDHPVYKSTSLRHSKQPLAHLPQTVMGVTGPQFGPERVDESDADLTRQHEGEPIGERIIVRGRVLDSEGKPLRNA